MPTGPVINAAPAADEYGQVVRVAGTVATTGGGGGGGAVTIADGADVAEGATTDAAVVTDTTGTISGKLRGLVKWAFERMPASLGQKTMAASLPVVVASDQSAVPVSGPLTDVQLRATPVPVSASAQPGVDIGDVTINNAGGASAVNIQDGGNSITVDSPQLPATLGQKAMAASLPVVIASDQSAVPVSGTFFQATQPVSVASGADVTEGATADAAVITDTTGTLSGKLRGLVKWAFERMPAALGQALMAASLPVVIASNQSAIPVSGTVTTTDGGAGKTLKTAVVSLSATGTVVAAVASKRIKVYAVKVICSAAISVNWRDGASTALEGAQAIALNSGFVENVNPPAFLFGTTAGNSLDLVITGIGTAAGRVSYWDDDAS